MLHAVAQAAAKHRKAVQPLLCLSVDFYVRLFVRIVESPEQCKYLQQKEAMVGSDAAAVAAAPLPAAAASVAAAAVPIAPR